MMIMRDCVECIPPSKPAKALAAPLCDIPDDTPPLFCVAFSVYIELYAIVQDECFDIYMHCLLCVLFGGADDFCRLSTLR